MGNRYKVVDCCVVRENGDHAPCGNAELACQRLNDGLVGEVMYNWYPECTNHPLTMPTSLDELKSENYRLRRAVDATTDVVDTYHPQSGPCLHDKVFWLGTQYESAISQIHHLRAKLKSLRRRIMEKEKTEQIRNLQIRCLQQEVDGFKRSISRSAGV
ncbi:MAG: hypothetical protein WC455_11525 [Dehalococcoidia bacterium]|jgi:hypothetical protein